MRSVVAAVLLLAASAAEAGFVVSPTTTETRAYTDLARELDEQELLEAFATELNGALAIDETVKLRYAECGEANAYYDGDEREILMCLELVESLYETLADDYEKGDTLDGAVAGAFVFFFFHELGHALIDVLELPVTGREEDAADQLSAWLLIDDEEGNQAVLDAAISFYTDAEDAKEIGATDFADEHSLDPQRYFNMICWVYGSNPGDYEALVDDWLPKARAERCENEYALLDRSWTKLLADHVREDADEDEPAPRVADTPRSSPFGSSEPTREKKRRPRPQDAEPVGRIREETFKD